MTMNQIAKRVDKLKLNEGFTINVIRNNEVKELRIQCIDFCGTQVILIGGYKNMTNVLYDDTEEYDINDKVGMIYKYLHENLFELA